ncbi:MAG TPA: hypothetical protein VJZ70_06305 [Limnochordia bacterium]|jgi:lipopolysaccharide export system protein LptA|nr:hypothetical protein [Limnochordia bacterium]
MNRGLTSFLIVVVVLGLSAGVVLGQGQVGTLEITGVPTEIIAGHYDRDAGVFFADVTEIEGALITVNLEDVEIVGKTMEWRTDDDYLIFTVDAKLTQPDFELTGEQIEYFGEDKKLKSRGNVIVITEDSTVYANQLDYDEETDEAIFTGNVRVIFSDGVLEGEKFLMLLEKSELRFFGSFQGEFSDSDKEQ